MADAKKCDRCGRFYIEKDKVKLVNHPKFILKDRAISWINVYDRGDNVVGSFDLCDDCAKKLYHFLCNEPELEERDKSWKK